MGAPTDQRTKNQTSFSWTRRDEWMDNLLEFPFIIKTSYLQLSFLYTLFVLGMGGEMEKIGMEMGGKNESNSFDVSYDDCYDDLIFPWTILRHHCCWSGIRSGYNSFQ